MRFFNGFRRDAQKSLPGLQTLIVCTVLVPGCGQVQTSIPGCSVGQSPDGGFTMTCDDGTSVSWVNGVVGPAGPAGVNGSDGDDGRDGRDGQDGTDGSVGAPGLDAEPCSVVQVDELCTMTCPDGSSVTWDCSQPAPSDADNDGIPDNLDNCPTVANTDQLDADSDGIGDVCDSCEDVDGDGACATAPTDCNDADAAIFPGATEIPYDGLDNDCDPLTLDDDQDADGFPLAHDCDDTNAAINPDATEICDAVDNDCDNVIDGDDICDGDGDGSLDNEDCNDNDANIYPGAPERCNGVDDDCDGQSDPNADGDSAPDCADNCPNTAGVTTPTAWYFDGDEDGYGAGLIVSLCVNVAGGDSPDGYDMSGGDCDDGLDDVHPGALELCDGIDQDCDGIVDDNVLDSDGDGVCDEIDDNDADGDGIDDANDNCPLDANFDQLDVDNDGIGNVCDDCTDIDGDNFCADDDCDDTNDIVFPGADELCNGLDDDCDTLIDNTDECADIIAWMAWVPDDDAPGPSQENDWCPSAWAPPVLILDQEEQPAWLDLVQWALCNEGGGQTFQPIGAKVCGVDENDFETWPTGSRRCTTNVIDVMAP